MYLRTPAYTIQTNLYNTIYIVQILVYKEFNPITIIIMSFSQILVSSSLFLFNCCYTIGLGFPRDSILVGTSLL